MPWIFAKTSHFMRLLSALRQYTRVSPIIIIRSEPNVTNKKIVGFIKLRGSLAMPQVWPVLGESRKSGENPPKTMPTSYTITPNALKSKVSECHRSITSTTCSGLLPIRRKSSSKPSETVEIMQKPVTQLRVFFVSTQ